MIASYFSRFIPVSSIADQLNKIDFNKVQSFDSDANKSDLGKLDQLSLENNTSAIPNSAIKLVEEETIQTEDIYQENLNADIEKLKKLTPNQLRALSNKLDKTDFFKALLPAALESEKKYGVPATITLAQAALESDWGRSSIGGYNIFGIKGSGPTGESIVKRTKEYDKNGKEYFINDKFAKFYSYHEAIVEHGKVFTRHPKFIAAVEQFRKDGDDKLFLKNIASPYSTSPKYEWAINKRIKDFNIDDVVKEYKTELSVKR